MHHLSGAETKSQRQESLINEKLSRSLRAWVMEKKFCLSYPDMQSIADDLDVSEEQLSYYCRTELGERFYTWRKGIRMRYAAFLLCFDKKTPISAIARMVGVNDRSDFRRQFNEILRMPPEEWRESTF